jgi:5'-nucleotidase / UDP-sugar diphosphatase
MKRAFLALVLFAVAAAGADPVRSITILHTNDLHAHISPGETGLGGFAYVAAALAREREHCQACLVLNAGDLVQGTPVSTIFLGMPIYEIGNGLGFDAATLGNHDFDYGWQQTAKFMATARYPIVVANLVDGEARLFTREPFVVLNAGGVRVAVIGAITESLNTLTKASSRGPWHTTPLVETVRRYVSEARGRADVVVVLAHVTAPEERALLHLSPDAPIVVSGHVHTGLPVAESENGGEVVRVKAYGEEIGRLDLKVSLARKALESWSWKRIPVSRESLAPAPAVARQVADWEAKVVAVVDKPLASAGHDFTKAEVKQLIERAMCDQTGADLAFMNLGGVRDVLRKGTVLVRSVWEIMPFDNLVVTGRFRGSRLPAVLTAGRQIDPGREYTVAVSDFTAENQGEPSQLGATGLVFSTDGPLLRNVLEKYLRKQAVLD